MSSIPKAVFIQQTDEGTDVFFLTHVGISASPTKAEHEWQVEKHHYIPPNETVTFFDKVKAMVPKWTMSRTVNPEALWFVQHVQDLS